MEGHLVVIEGIDGSGKATQCQLLRDHLAMDHIPFYNVTFPNYQCESSFLVRQYLSGVYGSKPTDVSPYTASTFYAIDRFHAYKTDFEKPYKEGKLIVCDRYVTSNICHQGAKFKTDAELQAFFEWIDQLEYEHMQLPRPGLVFWLDVNADTSNQVVKSRDHKKYDMSNGISNDIHEHDSNHLSLAYTVGKRAAEYFGWNRVARFQNGISRSKEDIHEEIYAAVKNLIS